MLGGEWELEHACNYILVKGNLVIYFYSRLVVVGGGNAGNQVEGEG
jgi:hypothetical protein